MGILDAPAQTAPRGWNLARFITKMQSGANVKVTVLGDSILQGTTASNPGTDDAVSIFCNTLATRFGVTVTKDNQAQGGRTAAWESIEKLSSALAANADLYILGISGKNDIAWEAGGSTQSRLTGYKTADSLAQVESWIRQIRSDKPNADIMVVSGNPHGLTYGGDTGPGANLYQSRYTAGLAKLAAAYGCAYGDGWGATPRAAGATNAADAAYLIADGVHPNSAGHAKIAGAMLVNTPASLNVALVPQSALVAATPPQGAVYPLRRTRLGVVQLTTMNPFSRNDRIIPPAVGGIWTAGNNGPWTSTTAGSKLEFLAKCSEVFLRFTYGAGQGVVDIIVDGQPWQSAVDLSAFAAGSLKLLSATGLTPGLHNVTIQVVSGSVTLESIAYTSSACSWVDIRDPQVVVSGTALGAASDLSPYYAVHSNATANGCTLTFDFIGTGLSMQMGRASTGSGFYWQSSGGFKIDGSNRTNPVVPTGFSGYGSMDLVTGLPYGKHTVAMTFASGGLNIAGFSVLDERPEDHPQVCEGINLVGDTVTFPFPWTDTPSVAVTSLGANPAGAASVTASSFVVTGTAGDKVKWRASCVQRGVY